MTYKLHTLSDSSRYPHDPDEDEMWNESSLVAWVDRAAELCGFIRYGFQPNRALLNYQCGVSTFDGARFRRTHGRLPTRGTERHADGYAIDDFLRVQYAPGRNRWQGTSDECEFELEMTEFDPVFDSAMALGIKKDSVNQIESANHYEVSGNISGHIRIGTRRIEIDCLGYGDRSWGPRHWAMRTHRWCVGTFGKDFTFSFITATSPPSTYLKAGYIVRNGTLERLQSLDVVVLCEDDGITHRGANVTAVTESNEQFDIVFDVHDNVLLESDNHLGADGLSTIRMGKRTGVGILEVSNNARGGHEGPPLVLGAARENGLSQR